MFVSLITTCRTSDVIPVACIADTLRAILEGSPEAGSRRHALDVPESVKPPRIGRGDALTPHLPMSSMFFDQDLRLMGPVAV